MNVVQLSAWDLAAAGGMVLLLGALSLVLQLGIARGLVISGARAVVQLLLLGLVLKTVFASANPLVTLLVASVMLGVAIYEVNARQQRPLLGVSGYAIATVTLFVSAFTMAWFCVYVVVQPQPWFAAQYVIPLLGMLLGNTMTGVAVSMDRLTGDVASRRGEIEARLALGHDWNLAVSAIRAQSLRAGLIPIINAMATAGIVSLPGMMTGQILAGTEPFEAAKYQILILLLIAASTGFGAIGAVWLTSRRLFDGRQRLRLERLRN